MAGGGRGGRDRGPERVPALEGEYIPPPRRGEVGLAHRQSFETFERLIVEVAPAVLEGITHVFYGFTRLFEALEHAELGELIGRSERDAVAGDVADEQGSER